jgi:hypothetical protein
LIRTHGFMLPMALTVALFVLIFAVGGSYLLNTNLQIGGNLKANTIARYASEAGLDHALSWLEAKAAANQISAGETLTGLTVNQSNQGSYTVTFTWAANTLTVRSTGTGPRNAEYQSQLVLDITQGARQNPLFGQGWISGNRVQLNGATNFQTARIHGDLGFASLSGTTQYSDGTTWTNIRDMSTQRETIPISGAKGVASQLCSTSTPNDVVCHSSTQMFNQFCPVFQTASAATTCDDMTTSSTSLIDPANAAKITAPSINALASTATGNAITNLVTGDPTAQGLCSLTNTVEHNSSLTTTSISVTSLNNLFSNAQVMPGDPRKVLCLKLKGGATSLVITGTGLNLSNYRLVVNFPLTFPTTSTLTSFDIFTSKNLTLNGINATDSKFFSGAAINMSSTARFTGNSTVAATSALTFNGNASVQADKGLAVISQGNITFNGASGIKSQVWAGGNITFNGGAGPETAYEGGAVAVGNIIRNGSATYILKANGSIENTDLPQTGGLPSVNVLSRR